MFIDASALCAILLGEPEGADLSDRIEQAPAPLTSAIAIFETVRALMRVKRLERSACTAEIDAFLAEAEARLAPIAAAEQELAVEALARFGKGRHPAALNMGDCFAYACAKTHGVPLLFKGEDFALTDIEPA
jgi:ribonuclease VapC